MSTRPIVGITTYVVPARWGPWEQTVALVPFSYVAAVSRAGGRAVLFPPTIDGIEETLESVQGVILAGGPDLDPALYRQVRSAATAQRSSERDAPELALARAALERDVPFLGICRGMQVLNVVRGGTLHQHLPDVVGHDGHATQPGHFDAHAVQMAPGTLVARVLGGRATVMSGHHQGLDTVGAGLVASAWSPDGAIEAVEDPTRRFALGVLWHPEQGADGRLFQALLEAVG